MNLMVIGDMVTIVVMILAGFGMLAITPWFLDGRASGIEIKSGSQTLGRFSLDADRMLEAQGPLGKTHIKIHDGHASITDSPCNNKYCVNMGNIGQSGGVLVCIPNGIIVSSVGGREDGLDAVSK